MTDRPVITPEVVDALDALDAGLPMTEQAQLIAMAHVLARVEAKLDAVLAFVAETRPLIEAGGQMAEQMAKGGPMALLSGMFGGGR